MQRYILVRLAQGLLTLLVLSMAVFLSSHLTGDPALYLLGPEGTQEDYEQLKKNIGLDKPLPVQYVVFLGNVVRGDFGTSPITGQSARDTLDVGVDRKCLHTQRKRHNDRRSYWSNSR